MYTLCFGTQCSYTALRRAAASRPSLVSRLPMSTRSGLCRSGMAVPSARNSGLERMSKRTPGRELLSRIVRIDAAVRHGTVDFSTMILLLVATAAMRRVEDST